MKTLTVLFVLFLSAFTSAQTCVFTNYGRSCGATLSGQQVRSGSTAVAAEITMSNAAPLSLAILVMGQRARPVALPASSCDLLVAPRTTLSAPVSLRGAASWILRIPVRVLPLVLDLQAVTIDLSRSTLAIAASNGLNLACR
jgi:hypothetical protein